MIVTDTTLLEVKIIEPKIFKDERGFFFESYNKKIFDKAIGKKINFVQDNHSKSIQWTLRGLHFQLERPQGKLIRCVQGEIFDVAVDIRKNSSTFGKWVGAYLNAENKKMLWIPEGFAHGFLVLTETAEVLYKATDFYHPESERSISWNDQTLQIQWPIPSGVAPRLSNKDASAFLIKEIMY